MKAKIRLPRRSWAAKLSKSASSRNLLPIRPVRRWSTRCSTASVQCASKRTVRALHRQRMSSTLSTFCSPWTYSRGLLRTKRLKVSVSWFRWNVNSDVFSLWPRRGRVHGAVRYPADASTTRTTLRSRDQQSWHQVSYIAQQHCRQESWEELPLHHGQLPLAKH